MARKVCLDSDVLINLLRNDKETFNTIKNLEAEYHLTSITVFESIYGRKKGEKIEKIIENIKIISFDKESAILAGNILSKLKSEGNLIDFRDLFIASTCIRNNMGLLTNNKKHFERLKKFGLTLI